MTARDRLLDALRANGCKVNTAGTASTCPAHEDRAPSLSIGQRTDKTGVVVKCHAGCAVEDVLAAVGMAPADLFDEPRQRGQRSQIIATYPYTDEVGTLLYEKVRLSPKDFRQRRPDGTEWAWSLNGTRRVLYRLPEVAEAVASGATVYLTEGEKDADALTAAGVTATTWTEGAWRPGQAPKWRDDYTRQLTGARVVIVRDRDEPGRHTAATIAALLDGAAADVTVVEPAEGKDAADHLAAGRTVADLAPVDLAAEVVADAPPSPPEPGASVEPHDAKVPSATRLVQLAEDRYRLATAPTGEPFAVPLAGPPVVRMFRGGSDSLRAELAEAYYETTGRAPAQQALADALLVLEGRARRADPEPLHLRVAEADGAVWLDLGDPTGRAVKVTGDGWAIATAPVLFRRTALTGPLPPPCTGSHLDELWALLNVAPADRPVVAAVLVAMLLPNVPHPVVLLTGEQGAGKSTASRTLAGLLDPSPAQLRKPPRDVEAWTTAAAGSWVVAVDNLSHLPDWLSDALCRAATGDGDVRRRLYSDGDLHVVAFRRCVILNGIDLGAVRDDLADRLVTVALDRIPDQARRYDADLAAAWTAAHPRILGAVLDLAARVLKHLPAVDLPDPPRMADFGRVLAAVDAVLGTDGLARYRALAGDLAADAVTGDPVLAAITARLTGPWTGTAAELLDLITDDDTRPGREWPKNARALTGTLRRRAPSLRRLGWTVDDLGVQGKANALRWRLAPPEASVEASVGRVSGATLAAEDADTRHDAPPLTCGNTESASVASKASDEAAFSLCPSLKEERQETVDAAPRENPGTTLATLATLADPFAALGPDASRDPDLADLAAEPPPRRLGLAGPGRCPACEFHVPTQGHRAGCEVAA